MTTKNAQFHQIAGKIHKNAPKKHTDANSKCSQKPAETLSAREN